MTSCTLCDLPTPDPPITDSAVTGEFCCRGCLEVARTLDADSTEDVEDVEDAAAALGTVPEPGDTGQDGDQRYLQVDGMHCATCEAFLESEAAGVDGVQTAEASYPSGMMRVQYDPETVDPDDLPGFVDGLGYEAEHVDPDSEPADRTGQTVGRLLVGGFFGMMTMLWYILFLYPWYLGFPDEALLVSLSGPAGTYLLANVWVMATIVLFYTGWPILRGAYVSLKAGHPNMDLLVGLAATTAYVFSVSSFLLGTRELYFDIVVVIVVVVMIGNYYETRVKERTTDQVSELTQERVEQARRRTGEGTETVSVEAVRPGDELVVKAGERVPVDGTIVEGSGAVDESLVTGESMPERKETGEAVIGGAEVVTGGIVVGVGSEVESTLDRLTDTLWEIQSSSPGAQRLADRIAAVFVPLVIVLALLTGVVHLGLGASSTGALLTGLTVLVVSCPCALGLATPLAIAAGLQESLDRGIVITNASAFEKATETDVVAFDKTGTLTTGRMSLVDTVGTDGCLSRAAAVEQFADHPMASAITDAGDHASHEVTEFETFPGAGVGARVDGEEVIVGRHALFETRGWSIPVPYEDRYESARADGQLPALVGWGGAVEGVLVVGDDPRPEWEPVVSDLAGSGRDVVVITGDEQRAAERFRTHPNVEHVFAGVPPEAKAEVVDRLRTNGQSVAMVGDGSNDAPALATADLGISLERGTRLAADAADAVSITDDLASVPTVFDLTRAARRRIRQNLGWAFAYNLVALPLAAFGLINPLLAAAAMALSSLLVVLNSSRGLLPDG